MRFRPDDKVLWLVTDPADQSDLGDVLTAISAASLHLLFQGGLTMDRHPTLFTERGEAEAEARGRLLARQAARAIAEKAAKGELPEAPLRLELRGVDGNLLLDADLR